MVAVARLLLFLSIFAFASRADAASVDISLVQSAPGSTLWNLQLMNNFGPPVGSLAFYVSDSLESFTIVDPRVELPIIVCPVAICEVPGFHAFVPSFTLPIGPSGPVLLGYFTSNGGEVQVIPGDGDFGGTAFDDQGISIFDVSLNVVPAPEPAVTGLLLLGIGLLGVARCRA